MTPSYDIGQQDIGQQDIVFFGPFSDGKAILIPRPYEPQISWKSKIPYSLENTNSIYPGSFPEDNAAASSCSVWF
jgi:hypothetical protein